MKWKRRLPVAAYVVLVVVVAYIFGQQQSTINGLQNEKAARVTEVDNALRDICLQQNTTRAKLLAFLLEVYRQDNQQLQKQHASKRELAEVARFEQLELRDFTSSVQRLDCQALPRVKETG